MLPHSLRKIERPLGALALALAEVGAEGICGAEVVIGVVGLDGGAVVFIPESLLFNIAVSPTVDDGSALTSLGTDRAAGASCGVGGSGTWEGKEDAD